MTDAEQPHPFLTVDEVAALTRMSESSVRRKIRSGEIAAVQLGGRKSPLRIPSSALAGWMYDTTRSADR